LPVSLLPFLLADTDTNLPNTKKDHMYSEITEVPHLETDSLTISMMLTLIQLLHMVTAILQVLTLITDTILRTDGTLVTVINISPQLETTFSTSTVMDSRDQEVAMVIKWEEDTDLPTDGDNTTVWDTVTTQLADTDGEITMITTLVMDTETDSPGDVEPTDLDKEEHLITVTDSLLRDMTV